MNEDNERRAFEEAMCAERGYHHGAEALRCDPGGRYIYFDVGLRWDGWQLGRARLAPKGEPVAWAVMDPVSPYDLATLESVAERVARRLNESYHPSQPYRVVPLYAAPVSCAQSNENRNSAPPSPEREFLRVNAGYLRVFPEYENAARRYLDATRE